MKLSKLGVKVKEDETLMRLVKKGDQKAFEELIDRHMRAIFRLSYSLLRDVGKAEDITQETFTTLWQQADSWQPTGQVQSWLYRIARNKSIDEIRARKVCVDIDDAELTNNEKSAYSNMFDSQVKNIIDLSLEKLPTRQSEAIILVHFLDNTNIKAAEMMGISVDALESLLARGRKKLKELLGDDKGSIFRENEDE